MSLEQLAEKMKGRPQVEDHQAAAAVNRAREPFHRAFLQDVYPHWGGPLKTLAGGIGVTRAGLSVDPSPDVGVTFGDLKLAIGEDILVETVLGVHAKMSYVFAGDVNDGQLLRVPSVVDANNRTILGDQAKVWTGPLDKLIAAAVEDVDAAAAMLPTILLDAIEGYDQRIRAENRAKLEAAAKAKADEEAAARAETEAASQAKTAAIEEADRRQAAEKDARLKMSSAPPTDE